MRATHDRKRYIIIRGYTANVFLFSLTDAETNGTAAQLAHATPSNIPRSLTTLIWMGDTIAAATSRGWRRSVINPFRSMRWRTETMLFTTLYYHLSHYSGADRAKTMCLLRFYTL